MEEGGAARQWAVLARRSMLRPPHSGQNFSNVSQPPSPQRKSPYASLRSNSQRGRGGRVRQEQHAGRRNAHLDMEVAAEGVDVDRVEEGEGAGLAVGGLLEVGHGAHVALRAVPEARLLRHIPEVLHRATGGSSAPGPSLKQRRGRQPTSWRPMMRGKRRNSRKRRSPVRDSAAPRRGHANVGSDSPISLAHA